MWIYDYLSHDCLLNLNEICLNYLSNEISACLLNADLDRNAFSLLNPYAILKINNKMSLFGVEINHQVNRLLVEAKQTLAKFKLFPNCRTLYRSFAQYDSNITGFVTPKQFEKVPKHLYSKAINSNGLFYKVY